MNAPLDDAAQESEAKTARSRRNIVMALALVAFVVLVFAITIVKLSGAG